MKTLLLGGGGRESAIAWALAKSPMVSELHCAPGNAGTLSLAHNHEIDPCDPQEVVEFASRQQVDLVVIGPEAPLVAGVADALRAKGIPVFGPGRAGAKLEGSKAFAKEFMKSHGIPTAPFRVCTTVREAEEALRMRTAPFVVKADGLAAGKGAFLLDTFEEAIFTARDLLENGMLGEAGETVVIEDFLPGRELTILAVSDGKTFRLLPESQDHKRAFDGGLGPNTGGMGAFSPVPWIDSQLKETIVRTVVEPTLAGLKKDGIDFRGVLYCGLMIDRSGSLNLLEYNVRMGDPETQVVLPSFRGDFAHVALACATGELASVAWPSASDCSVGVVMASGGYPGKYETGFAISGLDDLAALENVIAFHAGTRTKGTGVVTSGGRVLTVVGSGPTLGEARENAYNGVRMIDFSKAHYRKDIASGIGGC